MNFLKIKKTSILAFSAILFLVVSVTFGITWTIISKDKTETKTAELFFSTPMTVETVMAAAGELDCKVKSSSGAFNGHSVKCDSGYVATGGGVMPSSGGNLTASVPTNDSSGVPDGWAGSGSSSTGTITVYAVCCKSQ